MADRMIVMNGGIAEQIGTPLEVYETPQTLFAAQFIGSPAMNVFDAEVKDGQVHMGGTVIGPATGPDGPVKLGLRPEHLAQDPAGPLRARIQMAEPLGANTLLHGRIDGLDEAITISLPGVHPVDEKGLAMQFAIAPELLHLFDPETGKRR